MEKDYLQNSLYLPPTVEIVRVEVESGFAASMSGAGVKPTPYDSDWN